jgi:hypothetical protein
VRAAGQLKLPSHSLTQCLQAFMKLRASTMLGGVTYKDLNEAMSDMCAAVLGQAPCAR